MALPLLAALLTMLASSGLVWGQTESRDLPPVTAGEFCAPVGEASLDCPKTGADLCLCYLQTRTGQQVNEAPALARPVVHAKPPRPGRRVRILPEPRPSELKPSLELSPPTPPPRA